MYKKNSRIDVDYAADYQILTKIVTILCGPMSVKVHMPFTIWTRITIGLFTVFVTYQVWHN